MEDRRKSDNSFQDQVMSRLSDIEIQIATVVQEVKSNHKAFRDSEAVFAKILDRITDTIYGNGHPGLTSLKVLPERIETMRSGINSGFSRLWTSLGAIAFFIVTAVLAHIFKLL